MNPFEHHHDHGEHDHGAETPAGGSPDAAGLGPEVDPAQRSLADALRVIFIVLKAVMVVLLIAYLFSGIFTVKPNEKAVLLRFGKIVGSPGQQVKSEGGPYFAFPYPIDQVVKIPTSLRQVQLTRSFWYETPPGSEGKTEAELASRTGNLNPEKDSFLITGDAAIVHGRFTVTYQVTDPVAFLMNVKDQSTAEALVTGAAEQAAVRLVGQLSADDIFRGQYRLGDATDSARSGANKYAQQVLDQMNSGIRISFSASDLAFPLNVRDAFQQVSSAMSDRQKRLDDARAKEVTALGAAAGEAAPYLLAMIEQYERALATGDSAKVAELDRTFDSAFGSMMLNTPDGPRRITGEAATLISKARSDAVEIVSRVRSEHETFKRLLPEYLKAPRITLTRLWQGAREQILSGQVETFYVLPGQFYLDISRDPAVLKEREKERLRATQGPGMPK